MSSAAVFDGDKSLRNEDTLARQGVSRPTQRAPHSSRRQPWPQREKRAGPPVSMDHLHGRWKLRREVYDIKFYSFRFKIFLRPFQIIDRLIFLFQV